MVSGSEPWRKVAKHRRGPHDHCAITKLAFKSRADRALLISVENLSCLNDAGHCCIDDGYIVVS